MFTTRAREVLGQDFDSRNAIAAAVALAVASKAMLPTEAVTNPRDWYIQNVYPTVLEQVGKVNEKYVLNVNITCDLVRDLWELRYCTVHDPLSNAAVNGLMYALSNKPVEVSESFQRVYNSDIKNTLSYLTSAIIKDIC